MRQLTIQRRLAYFIAKPILSFIIRFLWLTCRKQAVIGEQHLALLLQSKQAMIPCYWHQQHIFCIYYLRHLIRQGVDVGFLISPSVDGEVPAGLVRSWGGRVVRGSATRTGAAAIRELYTLVTKDNVSPVHTPDGPTGPIFHFKPGVVMLAQMTQAPLVPLAFAAQKYWKLNSWDRFLIPKPFTKVQIIVGEPIHVAKGLSKDELEMIRSQAESAMQGLCGRAEEALK